MKGSALTQLEDSSESNLDDCALSSVVSGKYASFFQLEMSAKNIAALGPPFVFLILYLYIFAQYYYIYVYILTGVHWLAKYCLTFLFS